MLGFCEQEQRGEIASAKSRFFLHQAGSKSKSDEIEIEREGR